MSLFLLRLALLVGVLGSVASVAAHIATFGDADLPSAVMALHLGVFVAFIPVAIGLQTWFRLDDSRPPTPFGEAIKLLAFVRELPSWQKWLLGLVTAYATANFAAHFITLFGVASPGDRLLTRMFSGHWIAFYVLSAVFAHRLLALRDREEPRPTR